MTSRADNDRLTRVEGDALLGRMLRERYWIPFARSEALTAGAAPERVTLLGRDYVAFRGEDGLAGIVDEHCPHRRASLALARVEGCSLRCIYHGWRTDRTGRVVEVPSEGERSAAFAKRIKTNIYTVHEGGGLVWAFLGADAPAPPPLPFMRAPAHARWFTRTVVDSNWLQGFEGALDSYHLNWLHQGWKDGPGAFVPTAPPRYDLEPTPYGMRTAAVRQPNNTEVHFRVAEYVAPFYALVAGRQPVRPTDCSVFISVPVNDKRHLLFFGYWDEAGAFEPDHKNFPPTLDPNNLVPEAGNAENRWGQDRAAMAAGHFSGFTKNVLEEDVAVQLSMGPIVDRSQENLAATDLAIVRMREHLLALLKRFEAGEAIDGALENYAAMPNRPFSRVMPAGTDWRDLPARDTLPA